MTTATISPSGQIAIPKAVRERLGLEAGTQLSIDVQGEQLVIKRVDHNYPDWRSMEGMLRGGESLTKLRPWRKIAQPRERTTMPARRVVDSWAILAWLRSGNVE
jgi:AbrB family looped-hinge helix DNA binding protein